MTEFVPALAGVLLGLGLRRLPASATGGILFLLAGLLTGILCSYTVGELSRSWIYAVVDSAQVVAISSITRFLARKAQRTPESQPDLR